MSNKMTFGSICSGIEASQLAFKPFGFEQLWCSEIADFPSKVLDYHYPNIPNVGDMVNIPELILNKDIEAPDILCGGTPCQAFSLAGWKNGLADERGQLTMTFIEIANAIDKVRLATKERRSIILWENVEGVLNDKTNAFGNFIAGLAGYDEEIKVKKWPKAGFLEGKERNVAWRVIDAKYYGLPHQRKRLYVLAGDKEINPDKLLFEIDNKDISHRIKQENQRVRKMSPNLFDSSSQIDTNKEKVFYKGDSKFEVFREYTDCLYAAYGTKWNGNAAAYNGSLYVSENDRIRRFTPLECERLMGFPDNYTEIPGNRDTTRFQAVGNSWAVPVVRWIGEQLSQSNNLAISNWRKVINPITNDNGAKLYLLGGVTRISQSEFLNTSVAPNEIILGDLKNIVEHNHAKEKFYLSPKACAGILRRKTERNLGMNSELEKLMNRLIENVSSNFEVSRQA